MVSLCGLWSLRIRFYFKTDATFYYFYLIEIDGIGFLPFGRNKQACVTDDRL